MLYPLLAVGYIRTLGASLDASEPLKDGSTAIMLCFSPDPMPQCRHERFKLGKSLGS